MKKRDLTKKESGQIFAGYINLVPIPTRTRQQLDLMMAFECIERQGTKERNVRKFKVVPPWQVFCKAKCKAHLPP